MDCFRSLQEFPDRSPLVEDRPDDEKRLVWMSKSKSSFVTLSGDPDVTHGLNHWMVVKLASDHHRPFTVSVFAAIYEESVVCFDQVISLLDDYYPFMAIEFKDHSLREDCMTDFPVSLEIIQEMFQRNTRFLGRYGSKITINLRQKIGSVARFPASATDLLDLIQQQVITRQLDHDRKTLCSDFHLSTIRDDDPIEVKPGPIHDEAILSKMAIDLASITANPAPVSEANPSRSLDVKVHKPKLIADEVVAVSSPTKRSDSFPWPPASVWNVSLTATDVSDLLEIMGEQVPSDDDDEEIAFPLETFVHRAQLPDRFHYNHQPDYWRSSQGSDSCSRPPASMLNVNLTVPDASDLLEMIQVQVPSYDDDDNMAFLSETFVNHRRSPDRIHHNHQFGDSWRMRCGSLELSEGSDCFSKKTAPDVSVLWEIQEQVRSYDDDDDMPPGRIHYNHPFDDGWRMRLRNLELSNESESVSRHPASGSDGNLTATDVSDILEIMGEQVPSDDDDMGFPLETFVHPLQSPARSHYNHQFAMRMRRSDLGLSEGSGLDVNLTATDA